MIVTSIELVNHDALGKQRICRNRKLFCSQQIIKIHARMTLLT